MYGNHKRLIRTSILSILGQLISTLVVFILIYLFISIAGPLRVILPFNITQINQIEIFLASLIALIVSAKFIEKVPVKDIGLNFKFFLKDSLFGIISGFLLITSCVLIFAILGWYKIISINSFNIKILTTAILTTYLNAAFQEIVSRGIVFRKVEQLSGTLVALSIDILLFGIIHLANTGTSLYQALSIGILGSLYTLSYVFSRNLWLPISIHFAWNFFQGYLWGFSVSGGLPKAESIFTQSTTGLNLFTGGTFGPEAGLIALSLTLIIDIVLIKKLIKEKRLLLPLWYKSKVIE